MKILDGRDGVEVRDIVEAAYRGESDGEPAEMIEGGRRIPPTPGEVYYDAYVGVEWGPEGEQFPDDSRECLHKHDKVRIRRIVSDPHDETLGLYELEVLS